MILYLEMATAAQMYNEMNFENHLMNQAYLHPGNSLGKILSPLIRDRSKIPGTLFETIFAFQAVTLNIINKSFRLGFHAESDFETGTRK